MKSFNITIIFSLVLSFAFSFLNISPAKALYENEIYFTAIERSKNDLIDYQVLMELNGSNFYFTPNINTQNIAFYNEKKESLNYWIEKWDASAKEAKIWVKIPVLKANEIKNLIMDLNGTGESNGEATFDFFDDFNQPELDSKKWKKDVSLNYDEILNLDMSNSVLKINTDASNSSPNGSHALIKSFNKFAPGIAMRIKERDSGSSWYPGNFGFGQYFPLPSSALIKGTYTHAKYGFFIFNNSFGSLQADKSNYYIKPKYGSLPYPQDEWSYDNEWHTFDILWQISSAKFLKDSSIMAENTAQSTIPTISLPISLGDLGQNGAYSTSETNVDWIAIRKYVDPEPEVIISELYKSESNNTAAEDEKDNNFINEPDDKSILEVQASPISTANAEKKETTAPNSQISNIVFYTFILIVIIICILLIWIAKKVRDNKKAITETKLCLKCGAVTDKSIDKCAKCGSNNFSERK